MRRDLAFMMLTLVVALLALVSWNEHRAEQQALPLVNTAGVQAPVLVAPCQPVPRNVPFAQDRRA